MGDVTLAARHIAVEGPIGVGKTSLVDLLASRFEGVKILEDVQNPFLEPFYRGKEGAAFQVQLFFLLSRHQQHVELTIPCSASDTASSTSSSVMSETFIEYVLFRMIIAYEPAPLKPEASSPTRRAFSTHAPFLQSAGFPLSCLETGGRARASVQEEAR